MSTTETGKKPMSYAEYVDSVKAGAETARKNAEITANTTYQSALSAANANYNKANAEYGANAEALGVMGLRGSGYSNYLNSQAYAKKQSAYNNAEFSYQKALADAEARKAATILEADGMMTQYLQQKEAEDLAYQRQKEANKLNAFNTLMGNIGTYGSLADIKAIASANGIADDDPMLQKLISSRSAYIRNNLTGTNYTLKQLNDIYNNGNGELNETDYKALKDSAFNPKKGDIRFNGDNYDEEHDSYTSVLNTLPTRAEAEQAGDNTLLTQEDLTEQFNQMYRAKVFDKTFTVMRGNTKKDGKNIELEDADGNVYKVQYASGKDDAAATKAALQNVPKIQENQFFEYRGKIYLFTKDGSFLIEDRDFNIPFSEKRRYDALVKSLKN